MKNFKICAGMFLSVSVLLLTGCGENSHTLSCTYESEDQKLTAVFTFNDQEDEITYVEQTIQQKIPSDYSKEEIEEKIDDWNNSECKNSDYDKCSATTKGNYFVISVAGKPSESLGGELDGTIEEFIEDAEEEGFKCSR